MSENIEENILSTEIDYTFISLLSEKIKVLIIGGGRAGFLKAKSFSNTGCRVYAVSKEFCDDFSTLSNLNNLSLIQGTYNSDFILDKHIIIIATGDEEVDLKIANDCENYAKLYLFCSDFKKGNIVKPLQRETESIVFGLHSKSGNPNASIFTADLIKKSITEQDSFIDYINSLRSRVKGKAYKDEMMKFVSTEDFHFFYNNNSADIVLRLFYFNNGKD